MRIDRFAFGVGALSSCGAGAPQDGEMGLICRFSGSPAQRKRFADDPTSADAASDR